MSSRTCVMVVSNAVVVNGKQLHEVLLPDVIDMVISDSDAKMSYEFLRNKKVCELTGPIESVNRALQFFTPHFINIDRIENDEQVKLLELIRSNTYIVVIRHVSPSVNLSLFDDMHNVFLSTIVTRRLQPKVTPQEPPKVAYSDDVPWRYVGNEFKYRPLDYHMGIISG